MAQKRTRRTGSGAGSNGRSRKRSTSSRNGSRTSANGSRTSGDSAAERPALKARREENDANREYRNYVVREEEDRVGPPDIVLDVPELRVDLIHFELDDLDAHVALKANVLNLVKRNVGVDVHLSRVKLDIKGVDAEVVMKARLDHVAAVVDRLMTTLDRNPALIKGLSKAVGDIGQGAGEAVDKTGDAAKDVGKGAQSALTDVGKGAGEATGDIGEGAGQAVGDIGQGAGQAVGDVGQGAGQAVGQVGQGAGQAVGDIGQGGGQAVGNVGQLVGSPNGGGEAGPGTLAKEVAKLVAREIGHAASDEARELGMAATRKVKELGERREQKRADKHGATDAALRVADELGIDLADIHGSGSEGRITVKDVRQAQPA
jgi:hypothetical protein